jgi:glycosyltransferase involved in cell wall biosynthesis
MKISVVINSFNQAKTLERTIDSVVSQSGNKEIILVDAGSTDGSKDIINKYSHFIDKYIDATGFDRGQSHALNLGIRNSKGHLSCWINSDDWFYPNALKSVLNHFSENLDSDWAIARCDLYNESTHKVFSTRNVQHVDPGVVIEYGSKFWIPQQSTFWKTKFFHDCGGLNIHDHVTMDVDLFTRFTFRKSPTYIDFTTSSYSFHDESKGAVLRKESFASQNLLRYKFGLNAEPIWQKNNMNVRNIPVHVNRAIKADSVRWIQTLIRNK